MLSGRTATNGCNENFKWKSTYIKVVGIRQLCMKQVVHTHRLGELVAECTCEE
jgi:hypothetical protein